MFYFLGIVLDADWNAGWIYPTYVLCKSQGTATTRSGLRVYKQDPLHQKDCAAYKVIVQHPYGNDKLIEYLSAYRTRDHFQNYKKVQKKNRKKFYPHGYLCYFTCNVYGEPLGRAILIKHIPESGRKSGFVALEDEEIPLLSQRLALDNEAVVLPTVKPKFCQYSTKEG